MVLPLVIPGLVLLLDVGEVSEVVEKVLVVGCWSVVGTENILLLKL